jgi:hypothetical protein
MHCDNDDGCDSHISSLLVFLLFLLLLFLLPYPPPAAVSHCSHFQWHTPQSYWPPTPLMPAAKFLLCNENAVTIFTEKVKKGC